MAGFRRTVLIGRPVEEVFDFATDLTNAALLLPGVTKVEMLTDGGFETGAKFRETRRVGGKERTAVIEIVEHKRPEVHTASAGMFGMRATYQFCFSQGGAGTRVDMEAVVQGNLLWKLFLGMMSRAMEKEDGEYLTRLKVAIERKKPI
jgi:carbon monoxide dehydrogenase subunit G